MSSVLFRRFTWSRAGVAASAGLIVFGIVDASIGSRPPGAGAGPTSAFNASAGRTAEVAGELAADDMAAGRTATQFVTAVDTTNPSDPVGDLAVEIALAPQLTVSHNPSWPEAWTAKQRHTTVVLDSPGPALLLGGGQVAVIVTGTITVTSNSDPPRQVPLCERVTLRPSPERVGAGGQPDGGWVVTGVEAGP